MTYLIPGAVIGALVAVAVGAKRSYDDKQRQKAAAGQMPPMPPTPPAS